MNIKFLRFFCGVSERKVIEDVHFEINKAIKQKFPNRKKRKKIIKDYAKEIEQLTEGLIMEFDKKVHEWIKNLFQ